MEDIRIGFIGAGGIAKVHAYALQALKFYYPDIPDIHLVSVTSAHEQSRSAFALHYDFAKSESPAEFLKNSDINSVFILGPNNTHFEY